MINSEDIFTGVLFSLVDWRNLYSDTKIMSRLFSWSDKQQLWMHGWWFSYCQSTRLSIRWFTQWRLQLKCTKSCTNILEGCQEMWGDWYWFLSYHSFVGCYVKRKKTKTNLSVVQTTKRSYSRRCLIIKGFLTLRQTQILFPWWDFRCLLTNPVDCLLIHVDVVLDKESIEGQGEDLIESSLWKGFLSCSEGKLSMTLTRVTKKKTTEAMKARCEGCLLSQKQEDQLTATPTPFRSRRRLSSSTWMTVMTVEEMISQLTKPWRHRWTTWWTRMKLRLLWLWVINRQAWQIWVNS